jgi:2-methylisocitrate lyase-like PEP mutase family enzyme
MQEVAAIPRRVAGPCLLNVVHKGKTREIDLTEAERLGYKVAIVPALRLKVTIGACDATLAALRTEHRRPVMHPDKTVRDAFNRMGAEDRDSLRTHFRPAEPRRAAE